MKRDTNNKEAGPSSPGLTGDRQVGVGLNLSGQVPSEALEHPGVVGDEAIDLQAAAHQDPVARGLRCVDRDGVLVPNDIRLRNT